MALLKDIRSDMAGGLSSAAINLPVSICFGLIAFAPLGPSFAANGALSGIYACVFCGFFAALFGGTPIQITGPKGSLALLLASVAANLVANPVLQGNTQLIVAMICFCIFMAGLFQVVFGFFGLGSLVKFTPYPVYAGLMNGIGIILIIKYFKPLIGLDTTVSLLAAIAHPATFHSQAALVGPATLLFLFVFKKIFKKIPAVLAALIAGAVLYHLFRITQPGASFGPTLGALEKSLPTLDILPRFLYIIKDKSLLQTMMALVPSGLILGMLASTETLLSSMYADNYTSQRHDSNKELIGQGIGNMVSSCFGGLAGAGSIPRTVMNYEAGGRTAKSGMFSSFFILLSVIFLSSFIEMLPVSVIAAILISVGLSMFDSWSFRQVKKMVSGTGDKNEILGNLAITFLVTGITIAIDLMTAVVLGFVVATALFVFKTGKTLIKRKYRADRIRSKKMRSLEITNTLEQEGHRIIVFELQGPIFFGSADNLAREIEASANGICCCIIDFKFVNEIDSTGARILIQIQRNMDERGVNLLLSALPENSSLFRTLSDHDILKTIGRENIFPDTDLALEWAEEYLLDHLAVIQSGRWGTSLEQAHVFKGFDKEQLESIRSCLSIQQFKKGELVIREGDVEQDILILTRGSVSVTTYLPESRRTKRLVTFCPGIIVGEMAFLDGSPRSADVRADEDCEVYRLPRDLFDVMASKKPEIATRLAVNIAIELSQRLRIASGEIRALEDG